MDFSNLDPQLSPEEIEQVEKKIGLKFPPAFVAHYLKWNGGFPDHCIYQHEDEINQVCIEKVLPLKTDRKEHVLAQTVYRELTGKGVPKNFFPFGIDPCGAYFLVDCADSGHPIYFYLTDVASPNLKDRMRPLDSSFENFWKLLGPDID